MIFACGATALAHKKGNLSSPPSVIQLADEKAKIHQIFRGKSGQSVQHSVEKSILHTSGGEG